MITVNAMGDACPIPVIKTKKALQGLTGVETVEVLVDNEIAVKNVSKMAATEGGAVTSEQIAEGQYKVTIVMSGEGVQNAGTQQTAEESVQKMCVDGCNAGKNTVVVIGSDRMGEGNDELGKVLIKGFIFALTQLEELPKTMLFYNGGATLTTEGSDSLEDLKVLEEQGVEILTCGTCLDYYRLKDKLRVGTVTNMYAIVETMAKADNIIRP